ncbi:succinylglutamate desuccinylase [Candidatus Thioglobus autotrophicus]|uniref:Succinylglutamate desuccinylase n=1 Tax=Candidatus Thioglobus autotrophicus TaxID=1705394 RepID=A0A0M4PA38_9GAMM|nr:DUF1826 domain-containing protein [Candidatus Thioglobus autotrophicus]ALE53097.1 succinylglutamate desuccinylase [Candidatus Thioglobus autotrophicus]
MLSTNPIHTTKPEFIHSIPLVSQHASQGESPTIFTDIYQEGVNIAIWKRNLPSETQGSVKKFLALNPKFQSEMIVTPQNIFSRVSESLDGVSGVNNLTKLKRDIAELADMFCCLFEIEQVGLRLQSLDSVMCPRFHVDRVPCRLVTTYQGVATEWLPHEAINHTKLGRGSNGLPDNISGLYKNHSDIQKLNYGDVALLKGTLWQENGDLGLVHRSPEIFSEENRLLLTLDFVQ